MKKKNWPGVDQLVGKHDELNCADIGHCPFCLMDRCLGMTSYLQCDRIRWIALL